MTLSQFKKYIEYNTHWEINALALRKMVRLIDLKLNDASQQGLKLSTLQIVNGSQLDMEYGPKKKHHQNVTVTYSNKFYLFFFLKLSYPW